ncbi:hypothetical protein GCM10012285_41000 [Streptomyces kronopolitis]|uniref:Uncharacterized protein n=1 Tax=Streptomyces kronopolitis TaxID=1612435 RepID=A0ABQ2JQ71_9ACTN|nr:hypothetical protein [Streptomyces kronopolitis]GGN51178.1 hypothetical protein GCM10012285_41000 [Streptomyces kronopolitis]
MRPATHYGRERTFTSIVTLGAAALCAVTLSLAGIFLTDEQNEDPENDNEVQARFLSDLSTLRPSSERVVRTGESQTGIPVTLRFQQPGDTTGDRISFRCHGTGQATTTVTFPNGDKHSYPLLSCGATIASVAISKDAVITIQPSNEESRILWAIVRVQQNATHPSSCDLRSGQPHRHRC